MQGKGKIFVVCFNGKCGLTDYAVSLCVELAKRAEVTLLTARSYVPAGSQAGFSCVKLFRRIRHYPWDVFRFVFYVLRIKPDSVIFQSWLVSPLWESWIVRLFRWRGIRVMITVRDLLPHQHPMPWSKAALSFYYRGFDALIAHSETCGKQAGAMAAPTPVFVIPHGSYDLFRTKIVSQRQARQELGLPVDEKVVLFFGHIEPRKGCFEFLRVAKRMADYGKAHFVMAGPNELRGRKNILLEEFRGLRHLTIHDKKIPFEQVQLYFYSADLVALPYLEGTTSGVFKLAVTFDVLTAASVTGDLKEAIERGIAISLGAGPAIEQELEKTIQELCEGKINVPLFKEALLKERKRTSWENVGKAYLDALETIRG